MFIYSDYFQISDYAHKETVPESLIPISCLVTQRWFHYSIYLPYTILAKALIYSWSSHQV